MPSQKAQKIDLSAEYPCPCPHRGSLAPITLTEAFGCNRCQKIFVVEENGYTIEQLSTSYPSKKSWRWTGNRWTRAHTSLRENNLLVVVGITVFFSLLFVLLLLTRPPQLNIIIGVLLVIVIPLVPWLAYRR